MYTMDNTTVIISDVEQKMYSIYRLIYENTDLLEHTEDQVYRTAIKDYINKLKEELRVYKQLWLMSIITPLKKNLLKKTLY